MKVDSVRATQEIEDDNHCDATGWWIGDTINGIYVYFFNPDCDSELLDMPATNQWRVVCTGTGNGNIEITSSSLSVRPYMPKEEIPKEEIQEPETESPIPETYHLAQPCQETHVLKWNFSVHLCLC